MIKYILVALVFLIGLTASSFWVMEAPGYALLAILAAQPFSILCLVLPGYRIAKLCGAPVTPTDGTGAVSASLLLFKVLPSRLSEAAKPVILYLACACPISRSIAAVAFERFLDIFCVAALILLAMALNFSQGSALWPVLSVFIGILVIGAGLLRLLAKKPQHFTRLIDWLPLAPVRRFAHHLIEAAGDMLKQSSFCLMILLSAGTWACAFGIFYLYFAIAGTHLMSLGEIVTVYVMATIGLAVAIAPGGLGTYEGAIVVGLGFYGYAVDEALLAAIFLRIANTAPAIPATLIYLSYRQLSMAQLIERIRGGKTT